MAFSSHEKKQITETIKEIIKEINDSDTYKKHLNIILDQKNGYKYESIQKYIKHFPAAHDRRYEKCTPTGSFSLSSKDVPTQLQDIKETVNRRNNMMHIIPRDKIVDCLIMNYIGKYNVLTPLAFKNNIIKYESPESKRSIYKKLNFADPDVRSERFDVIYAIKTENWIHYVNNRKKTFCDTIFVCVKANKQFQIMFDAFDKHEILTFGSDDTDVKQLYNNKEF